MPVYRLDPAQLAFPHPKMAEPGGLLAVGGLLEPEWLVLAYQYGIFPWFEEEGEFYWFSPDPRCVLYPAELKVHKSMRSVFNSGRFQVTLDQEFEAVMLACANVPRGKHEGSWITDAFLAGYKALFEKGIAHSVEVWEEGQLVGGLYGVSLGKIFYGESMFAKATNASKVGFITLVRALEKSGFSLIDCQQETPHLISLGARNIPRKAFMEALATNIYERSLMGRWHFKDNGEIGFDAP